MKCLRLHGNGFSRLDQKELPLSDLELPKPENKWFVIRHNSVTHFQKLV